MNTVNLAKRSTYFATKFDSAVTEALYALSMDWMSDHSGNSEAPCGWFTEVLSIDWHDLRDALTLADHDDAFNVLVQARVAFDQIFGHWIIRGDYQGFVWAAEYDTHESAQSAYAGLESEYAVWDEEDEFSY